MDITALDHLVLTVRDIEATCRFYAGALGLRRETFDGRTALRFGRQRMHLHETGKEFEPKASHPAPGSADLCFLTDAPIAALVERLGEVGVQIEQSPVARIGAAGPLTSIYLRDPDGNLIEIASLDATPKA